MSTEQNRLQGKTRFASWWLIAVGALAAIMGVALIPMNPSSGYSNSPISAAVAYTIFLLSLSLPGILNIIAGTMLLKKRQGALTLAAALLAFESIACAIAFIVLCVTDSPSIASTFIFTLVLCLVPLVLLILDRRKTKTD